MNYDIKSTIPLHLKLWKEDNILSYNAAGDVLSESNLKFIKANEEYFLKLIEENNQQSIKVYPLTHNQKAQWFFHQADPENISYNIAVSGKIKNPFDLEVFKKTIKILTERHILLRTVFADINEEESGCCQIVFEREEPYIQNIDVSGLTEKQIKDQIYTKYRIPFDLRKGPNFKTYFFTSEEITYFLFNVHHIICDAWSLKIFLKALFETYNILLKGSTSDFEPAMLDFGDYVFDLIKSLNGEKAKKELAFWNNLLKGKEYPLVLPYNYERPSVQAFNGKTHHFSITTELSEKLNRVAEQLNVTPNIIFYTLFELLLSKLSLQKQFYIGMPVAARTQKEFLQVFGYMINLVPVNCSIDETKKASEYILENKSKLQNILDNQDIPFPYLVKIISPKRDPAISPMFQVMYNFMNKRNLGILLDLLNPSTKDFTRFGALEICPYPIDDQEGQFDLTLEILHTYDRFDCVFKYNTDLFRHDTITYFEQEYVTLIDTLISNPDFLPYWFSKEDDRLIKNKIAIKITGTFTTEPIQSYLEFWFDKLNLSCSVDFPGYNQVFHQLLNPSSEFNLNHYGYNILLIRLEDWLVEKHSENIISDFIRKIEEFEDSLSSSLQINRKGKYILAFCPQSTEVLKNNTINKYLIKAETKLSDLFRANPNVIILKSEELIETYRVFDYYEEMGEEIGNIPYKVNFFISLATIIVRRIHIPLVNPFKAIVVDCDNTLWKGVVAEDGTEGVKIGEGEQNFQRFLIEQHNSGVLICLCSKNMEEDVLEVFEKNRDMILKREHISFHRINWNPKSVNIRELASEINIGTDSFVFFDDNPVECAEVMENLPGVLTIQVPEGGFSGNDLKNTWVFDRLKITDEDGKRAQKYREEGVRSLFKAKAGSYRDFIAGLDLKIAITEFKEKNFPRISQLTFRTNQFNFTGRKRDENEIRKISADNRYECFQVTVTDRFGDYGLTGVIISDIRNGYTTDTFLLSCRVLGKGVEHAVVKFLGERARHSKSEFLTIDFIKSPKNIPAENFLTANFRDFKEVTDKEVTRFRIPAEIAVGFKFDPDSDIPVTSQENDDAQRSPATISHYTERNAFFSMIIDRYLTVEGILSEFSASGATVSPGNNMTAATTGSTEDIVMRVWQQVLNNNNFTPDDNFFDIGGHSVLIPQIVIDLKKSYNIEIKIVDIFQYPTVRKLAAFIAGSVPEIIHLRKQERSQGSEAGSSHDIAVTGMACRYPGAANLDEFWKNLLEGRETIKRFTDDELEGSEINYPELKDNPDYIKARGIINDIDSFDADFFDMTPKEAALTDPQHRVWLEIAWDAFENAGLDPFRYKGSIGVFAGGFVNTYLLNNVLRDSVRLENYIRMRSAETLGIYIGNDVTHIPTKTAYKFNLRGPAVNVQTACSTSLVAISQACQSLFMKESDVVLAGGIFIMVPQESGYLHEEGAITSSDGVCRPFDADSNGTVFSNGAGAVILKRLEDALRDGDNIYAVVKGWATNNDGNNKISYLAPSVDGQAEVIMAAHESAGISSDQISYIEGHGTATRLGDPIEVTALTKAFSVSGNKKQFCGIGSVKSNIGHTDAAAGVASFIKVCMAASTRMIPPTINFKNPNPHIDFTDTQFYVQSELKKWTDNEPLIMGVSSFGVGGTNAHIIVEELPRKRNDSSGTDTSPGLILFSAKTQTALKKREKDFVEFIKDNRELRLSDISFTLGSGRKMMRFRSYFTAESVDDIISGRVTFCEPKETITNPKIAFMFPGQGAQYPGMGKILYGNILSFRQIMDECFEIFRNETGSDLKTIIFGADTPGTVHKLDATEITQPALFSVEYAMARLMQEAGITPDYLIGHSIGEYTAACLAGVFDLPSAMRIVIRRGSLMQKMPSGKMLAVRSDAATLRSLAGEFFELAADNAASACTISVKPGMQEYTEKILTEKGIAYLNLNTSHAFHSEAFDPVLREFEEYIGQFKMNPPGIPFISCLTGKHITPEESMSPAYWAKQLRHTVRFREGIERLTDACEIVFLEAGTETHLSSLTRQNKSLAGKEMIVTTLGKSDGTDERIKVMDSLGKLFRMGINPDIFPFIASSHPVKVPLPAYPYERKRYWIDYRIPVGQAKNIAPGSELSSEVASREAISPGLSDDGENAEQKAGIIIENSLTESENLVMNIWSEAFMRKDIGITDNFFEIGGDSLLAITVVARIKAVSKKDLSLKTFLKSPRIRDLAKALDGM